MFAPLKRWFAPRSSAPRWNSVAQWASAHGRVFKRSRDGSGFIVGSDGEGAGAASGVGAGALGDWRLEWGTAQRSYIAGPELRLRLDGSLPPDMQMLVLTRPLLESLESATFDKFVEFNETHIDVATPEELRWLAMYQRAEFADLPDGRALAARFAAVALDLTAVQRWMAGPLGAQLLVAGRSWLAAGPPFVLMVLKGRLYLRLQLALPDLAVIEAAVALFETAHSTAQALSLHKAVGGARQQVRPR